MDIESVFPYSVHDGKFHFQFGPVFVIVRILKESIEMTNSHIFYTTLTISCNYFNLI
jgi:hypothetical protein